MFTEYADFAIEIQPRLGGGFPLLARGPGGEARCMLLPADTLPEYARLMARLTVLDTDEATLTLLGRLLWPNPTRAAGA
jgi:hypothetical protein